MRSLRTTKWSFGIFLLLALLGWSLSCGPARFDFTVNTPTPLFGAPTSGIDRNQRLGTRNFVASTLSEIFGGASHVFVRDAIHELISTQLAPFGGGPCDRYAEDCPLMGNGSGRVDPGGESQALVVPAPTTGRFALTLRVCEKILSNDDAVLFAISQTIQMEPETTIPVPLEGDIVAAYGLFFPDQLPSEEVLNGFLNVTNSAFQMGNELEAWRFLFLILCTNPSWQIP